MSTVTDAAAASFAALTHKLDYLDEVDTRRVRDAYRFADEAHLGQFRASGEPYITHPIAVAGLCADWKLDAQAIMAALMHDAMEDCGVTKIELIERFGAPTAEIVDGLTKLDKLHFSTKEESQAESFRKMLLAMARDVRVILIKLADRLHNMRTMAAMVAHKRSRIARCRSCPSSTSTRGATRCWPRRSGARAATGATWWSASARTSSRLSATPRCKSRCMDARRRFSPSTAR